MRKDNSRSRPYFRSIMTAFLAASLSGEALHYHEEHNPHGNRRERIEEARERASEALHDKSVRRNFNAGGNPQTKIELEIQALIRRRRESRDQPRRNRKTG